MPKLIRCSILISILNGFFSTIKCLGKEPPYDFIIVGGGTSGCALATRLSEDENFQVLLLESGGFPKDGMEIPSNTPDFVADSNVMFSYPAVPQKYAARRNNGAMSYISGRVLGGTSTVNYMWFNRGNPLDWNKWAELAGDDSWNYKNMLENFKKVETYAGEFPSDQHGNTGPVTVSRPKYSPGLDYWLNAGKELGYPLADSNGPQKRSFAPTEFSKRHGRRVSSLIGYLRPILFSRSNLHIILFTNATQIIFEGTRAVGVKYKTLSKLGISEKKAYARKEVILCAGVIGSPLLLQRSGIGPKAILEAAGIPVIQELPVGANFHDHVSVTVHLYVNNASVVFDEYRDLTKENWELFKVFGDGPYSTVRGGTGQAFVVSSIAYLETEREWPDLHLCMAHGIQPYYPGDIVSNNKSVAPTPSEVPMSVVVFLVRPRSTGSVYLNPEDPHGYPILDLGYFSDPRDTQSLLDGIKETVRIFENTKSYQSLAARISDSEFPDCQNHVFKSDQYWRCHIRQASGAGLHAAGTCRMGKAANDSEAVVDPKLRVIGVTGLRVVDTSVMPLVPNANPQGALYGLTEKAATLILDYWHGLADL